jgi:hypothetical protein
VLRSGGGYVQMPRLVVAAAAFAAANLPTLLAGPGAVAATPAGMSAAAPGPLPVGKLPARLFKRVALVSLTRRDIKAASSHKEPPGWWLLVLACHDLPLVQQLASPAQRQRSQQQCACMHASAGGSERGRCTHQNLIKPAAKSFGRMRCAVTAVGNAPRLRALLQCTLIIQCLGQACCEETLESLFGLTQLHRPPPPWGANGDAFSLGLGGACRWGGNAAPRGSGGDDEPAPEAAAAKPAPGFGGLLRADGMLHPEAEPLLQQAYRVRLAALLRAHAAVLQRCVACGRVFSAAARGRQLCDTALAGALKER